MRKPHTLSVGSGYRLIQHGSSYNPYFPTPDKEDKIIIRNGEVEDIIGLMKQVVWRYIDDTKYLAPLLKRSSRKATCQAIWEFIYTHIQYQFDKQGLEQLRRPARTWADRRQGADCDCMSIFASSILTNLQIPHSFRITKYSRPAWQHVYVVVPSENGTAGYLIDGVVAQFNYEKPYTAKKDYAMDLNGIDVAVLSGYEEEDALAHALLGLELVDDESELGAPDDAEQLDALYRHLVATRKAVAANPQLVVGVDDPQGFLKMLDYAIQYWHTDKREDALSVLERYEEQLNLKRGFTGLEDDDELEGYDYDELGALKPKKFFKSVKKAAAKVGKGVAKGAKAVGKGAAKVGKVVGKAVLKFNPLSVAARAGFLLAVRLNLKKMGTKLKWGYASQQQAAAKGISAAQWQKSKRALEKVEKLFSSKLQGKKSTLRSAVLKGRAGNLNGVVEYVESNELEGLGIAPAAALAAAVPLITAVMGIFKKDGMVQAGEDTGTANLSQELDSGAQAAMQAIESEDPEIRQVPTAAPQPAGSKLSKALSTAQRVAATALPMVQVLKQPAQPASTALISYSQPQAAPQATAAAAPASGGSGGVMRFIQANPIPSLLIGGVVAWGVYRLLAPAPSAGRGLSGLGAVSNRPRKSSPRKKPTARKTTARKTTAGKPIRRVRLF